MPPISVRTDHPAASARPGGCYRCSVGLPRRADNGDVEPYIDFNITIDFEGPLLICGSCILESAVLLGCSTPTQAAALQAAADAEKARADCAVEALHEADEAKAAFAAVLAQMAKPAPEPDPPADPAPKAKKAAAPAAK